MGQSHKLSQRQTQLISKLDYIQTQTSAHYGQITVYRIRQKPFDYYLRYRQTYQNNPTTRPVIQANKELYDEMESHRNVVKVEAYRMERSYLLCSDAINIECYCKYFNYTLENAIMNKQKSGKMFKDADLVYILDSLVDVGARVSEKRRDIYLGVFKINKIYLSTEGFIKIYPFKMNDDGRTLTFNSSQITNSHTCSPKKASFSYAFGDDSQNDQKDIATIMTQLMLLQSQHELSQLSPQHIKFRLEKVMAGKISPRLRFLVIRIMEGEQLSWTQLQKELKSIRDHEKIRPSYSLRLDEDISFKDSQILEREQREFDFQKAERQSKLSSLNANLIASKIEPLSRQKHT